MGLRPLRCRCRNPRALAGGAVAAAAAPAAGSGQAPTIQRITPILTVDEIEPVLPLWERLGFERTDQVEVEGRLIFVILGKDDTEVMYPTLASVEADLRATADALRGSHGLLFIEVANLVDSTHHRGSPRLT